MVFQITLFKSENIIALKEYLQNKITKTCPTTYFELFSLGNIYSNTIISTVVTVFISNFLSSKKVLINRQHLPFPVLSLHMWLLSVIQVPVFNLQHHQNQRQSTEIELCEPVKIPCIKQGMSIL